MVDRTTSVSAARAVYEAGQHEKVEFSPKLHLELLYGAIEHDNDFSLVDRWRLIAVA